MRCHHRPEEQSFSDAEQHRLSAFAASDVLLLALFRAQFGLPPFRGSQHRFNGCRELLGDVCPYHVHETGFPGQFLWQSGGDHSVRSEFACSPLSRRAEVRGRVDHKAGQGASPLHDAVALSQHGELVWDSTECIGVYRGVEVAGRKWQGATVSGDEPGVTREWTSRDIRLRLTQGVEWNVAADEVAFEPLRDVESRPSVTAPDFQETAAGGWGQNVAQRVCLLDRREAVLADFVAEDGALDSTRHRTSTLGVSLSEAVDGVRRSHGPIIPVASENLRPRRRDA